MCINVHGSILPAYRGASPIQAALLHGEKETQATYCTKIDKEDGLLDWQKSAKEIYQMWQAYTPWPGIFTHYEGKRLLLESVSLFRHSDEGRIQVPENGDTGSFVPQDDGDFGQVVKLEDGRI